MIELSSRIERHRDVRQTRRNLRLSYLQRGRRLFVVVVALLMTSQIGLRSVHSAAGALDATFGMGGNVTTSYGDGARSVAVAVQSDGKIVVAGSTFTMSPTPPLNFEDFALVRVNIDGSLDTNFGVGGKTSTDFGGNADRANGVTIQSDGKILAVGDTVNPSGASFAIARYNSNGTLDTSFDLDGKLTTDFGGDSRATAVVVQTNGKIVVAGNASDGMAGGFGLARYNIDGSLDSSFDGDGRVITAGSGGASAVILQSDEKLIAAGYGSGGDLDSDFTIIRYNPNGSVDTSFDTDGKVTTDFSGGDDDEALAVTLQSDGKILAVGYAVMQTGDSAIARYNSNGSLDSTFDMDGKLIFDMGFGDEARSVLVQANGKILTAGYVKTGGGLDGDFALARFNTDGTFDTSFDNDGKVFTDFSGNNKAFAAALQSDGKIVAVGEYGNLFLMGGIALVRYLTATNKPSDFDGDGRSDIGVFRPTNGAWYFLRSSDSSFGSQGFGTNGDRIAPGDYDGDGTTDFAVFRPADGTWYILRSSNNSFVAQPFGVSTDSPAPADYDGDGKADIAVFRPSNGTWYITQSSNGAFRAEAFGTNGDIPVPADYDGDGRSDVGVFRPSNGTWYLLQSTAGFSGQAFGQNEDKPVQGDYDADGKSDLAVFRPSTGTWYLLQSTAGFTAQAFGVSSDVPSPGDYDGDNKTDIAVFRPSTGTWYLQQSTSGFSAVQFGANGDVPVPSAFVP